MNWLLLAATLTPLILVPLVVHPGRRWLLWIAPLPAFAVVLLPPDTGLALPWLLFGTRLVLDTVNAPFLLLTALVWTAAAFTLVSDPMPLKGGRRFRVLLLITLSGNLWLVLAAEPLGFYLGFAVMGLAAYGLILEPGDQRQRRTARIYLAMTLIAELALFAALVLMAQAQGLDWHFPVPPQADGAAIALLLLGLGIKGGLMPLHLWLPPTYAIAPSPIAAVLSGAMSKAALLGWLRLLPLDQAPLPAWGLLLAGLGLISLLIALGVGLSQSDPRRILAYSSISKSGLFTLVLGLMLLRPELATAGTAALGLYAVHHALVKAGLFLGLDLHRRGPGRLIVRLGLILLAAALAAVPLTSGALVKSLLKPLFNVADWAWLDSILSLASVGTALLMIRFIWLIESSSTRTMTASQGTSRSLLGLGTWLFLVGLTVLFPFALGDTSGWLSNLFPPSIALLLAAPLILAAGRKAPRPRTRWGMGIDALAWLELLAFAYLKAGQQVLAAWSVLVERPRHLFAKFIASVGTLQTEPIGTVRPWSQHGALYLVTLGLLMALLILR
ncbi:NADH/ubiquinone/plastoquinone (complex I) [Caldichromatium japonicum]|uniref:NADH/ubiquinone/plastoquinone (Complex I) n=1 Tax=Caldichromatium japonicum TaxID=2699430 RepID=A0A6G7VBU1_9GAMM|nr:proton-conducting transporter membrane subunit [Caldichromatium japonicum]QIK37345.1 NADH/ubiquinone/plastoquinone (complex I) [Caldichromatium japonicum]